LWDEEVHHLPRNLSAEKSDRQGIKRHLRNKMIKSRAKTLVKDFVDLVDEKKKDEAKTKLAEVSSYLDKAVSKGIFHRNTAARKKSRMTALLKSLGA
jgi:small subunit ribosomal protein S20